MPRHSDNTKPRLGPLNRGKGPYERANVPRQSRETKGCLGLLGVKAVDRISLYKLLSRKISESDKEGVWNLN